MKKIIVISLVLIALLSVSTFAYVGGGYETILNCWVNQGKIFVQGTEIKSNNGIDSILYKDSNYVKLRDITENLNCNIKYNPDTKQVDITQENYMPVKCINIYTKNDDCYISFKEISKDLQFPIMYKDKIEKGKIYCISTQYNKIVVDGVIIGIY